MFFVHPKFLLWVAHVDLLLILISFKDDVIMLHDVKSRSKLISQYIVQVQILYTNNGVNIRHLCYCALFPFILNGNSFSFMLWHAKVITLGGSH